MIHLGIVSFAVALSPSRWSFFTTIFVAASSGLCAREEVDFYGIRLDSRCPQSTTMFLMQSSRAGVHGVVSLSFMLFPNGDVGLLLPSSWLLAAVREVKCSRRFVLPLQALVFLSGAGLKSSTIQGSLSGEVYHIFVHVVLMFLSLLMMKALKLKFLHVCG